MLTISGLSGISKNLFSTRVFFNINKIFSPTLLQFFYEFHVKHLEVCVNTTAEILKNGGMRLVNLIMTENLHFLCIYMYYRS